MKLTSLCRALALAALCLLGTAAFAAPVLIGNKNVAAEKLDGPTVKAVFLSKKVTWDGAGRITLAVLKSGPVADAFLQGAVDMNASAFNNHWRRLAMTGGGTAPKSFEKEEDLRKFVADTPGAVGFVDAASADASVATLTVAP
jgi:ABC-type phosphate transport system substrate-binding protein